jgi:hypothetical protein
MAHELARPLPSMRDGPQFAVMITLQASMAGSLDGTVETQQHRRSTFCTHVTGYDLTAERRKAARLAQAIK